MESKDLNAQIVAHIEALAASTDEAYKSEQMKRYLESAASFYAYSVL